MINKTESGRQGSGKQERTPDVTGGVQVVRMVSLVTDADTITELIPNLSCQRQFCFGLSSGVASYTLVMQNYR